MYTKDVSTNPVLIVKKEENYNSIIIGGVSIP